jgi:phytoene synthase
VAVADMPAKNDAAKRASGSSFYTAMRILPRRQRQAMYEIYAFCRHVDDIADSEAPRPERLEQLAIWRNDIAAIYLGTPPRPMLGLERVVRAFDLAREDFSAVIDGMEMDVTADIRAPDWDTLDRYCDRVASAVGRLSVRVFGLPRNDGIALAHHLGRALQLTNILRDLDEDAAVGRLYLPRETLRAAGITATNPAAVLASPDLAQACVAVASKALAHFAEADAIMAKGPRRAVRAPRIMSKVYRATLDRLMARGFVAPRRPVRIARVRLLWIVLSNAFL